MPVSYQDFVLSNQYFGTPMPTDPKMAMAEVQWRRVKLDNLDKLRRQLQPLGGVRNNPNDSKATSGSITLRWDG